MTMKRLLPVLIAFLSLAATAKEIWINVDFCDEIHQRWKTLKRGMIAEDVTNIVRNCRRAGADGRGQTGRQTCGETRCQAGPEAGSDTGGGRVLAGRHSQRVQIIQVQPVEYPPR